MDRSGGASAPPADADTRRRQAPDPFASGSDGPGPVFHATYDSECAADGCIFGGRILEDDAIQADGAGDYTHEECAGA